MRNNMAINVAIGITAVIVAIVATLIVLDTTDDSDEDQPQAEASDSPACSDLVGMDTQDILDMDGCIDETGGLHAYGAMTLDCPDSRTLNWNDTGWGYTGEQWQAHSRDDGQLIPPQADMDACG